MLPHNAVFRLTVMHSLKVWKRRKVTTNNTSQAVMTGHLQGYTMMKVLQALKRKSVPNFYEWYQTVNQAKLISSSQSPSAVFRGILPIALNLSGNCLTWTFRFILKRNIWTRGQWRVNCFFPSINEQISNAFVRLHKPFRQKSTILMVDFCHLP